MEQRTSQDVFGRRGLVIALVSLILLPYIPILPGLGSLLGLTLSLFAYSQQTVQQWVSIIAIVISGGGITLSLLQLVAALSNALGMGSL